MQPVDPRIAAQRPTGCCSARLLGSGTRSPLYLIGDAASRRELSRVGYFITLNGLLNGHPPSCINVRESSQIVGLFHPGLPDPVARQVKMTGCRPGALVDHTVLPCLNVLSALHGAM